MTESTGVGLHFYRPAPHPPKNTSDETGRPPSSCRRVTLGWAAIRYEGSSATGNRPARRGHPDNSASVNNPHDRSFVDAQYYRPSAHRHDHPIQSRPNPPPINLSYCTTTTRNRKTIAISGRSLALSHLPSPALHLPPFFFFFSPVVTKSPKPGVSRKRHNSV